MEEVKKVFKVAQIRDLLNQVYNEKITFSRFVEILNEQAANSNPETMMNLNLADISTQLCQINKTLEVIADCLENPLRITQ